jgi:hypothetical protein
MSLKKIIPLAVVAVLALAAVLGATALNAVQASAPAANSQAAPVANTTLDNFGRGGMGHGGFTDTQLAAALNITTDQLTAAYTSATDEALKAAVTQGLITQAQADQIKARGNNFGELGRFGAGSLDYDTFLAKALNISTDQLKAAYQKAFTANLDQAVKDGKLTQEQADLQKAQYALANSSKFQSALKSAYETTLKQAVTDGILTQAQADLILKNQAAGQPGMGMMGAGKGPEMGGGRGEFGGPGAKGAPGTPNGMHGGRGGQQNAAPTPAAPQG